MYVSMLQFPCINSLTGDSSPAACQESWSWHVISTGTFFKMVCEMLESVKVNTEYFVSFP